MTEVEIAPDAAAHRPAVNRNAGRVIATGVRNP
jgi:hypothetical protein